MAEINFFKEVAACILQFINSEKYPDLEKVIVDAGGFNRRIFSPEKFFRQQSWNLFRFLINMSLRITEDDFREIMQQITEKIIDISYQDQVVADINRKHTKKESNTFINPNKKK